MITIETDKYVLEQIEEGSTMFDLKLKLPVYNKKTKEIDRYEFKQSGYGMTLDTAISKIAMYDVEFGNKYSSDLIETIKNIKETNETIAKEMQKEFYKQLKKNRK